MLCSVLRDRVSWRKRHGQKWRQSLAASLPRGYAECVSCTLQGYTIRWIAGFGREAGGTGAGVTRHAPAPPSTENGTVPLWHFARCAIERRSIHLGYAKRKTAGCPKYQPPKCAQLQMATCKPSSMITLAHSATTAKVPKSHTRLQRVEAATGTPVLGAFERTESTRLHLARYARGTSMTRWSDIREYGSMWERAGQPHESPMQSNRRPPRRTYRDMQRS